MKSWASQFFKAFMVFAVIYCVTASMEEASSSMMMSNNPYGRSMVNMHIQYPCNLINTNVSI